MARILEQLLETENPEIVTAAKRKAETILLNIVLGEIQVLMKKTQGEMDSALGVKHPTVDGMEKLAQDLTLSSLKRYVESAGGKVTLEIELPDGQRHGYTL